MTTTRLTYLGTQVTFDGEDSGDPDKKRRPLQKRRMPLHLSKSRAGLAGEPSEVHHAFHNTVHFLQPIKAAISAIKCLIRRRSSCPSGYLSAEYLAEENRERVLRRMCG